SLYDEVDRISESTNYNGFYLLNGASDLKNSELTFRVGSQDTEENVIKIKNFDELDARPKNIGLISARGLVRQEEGVSIEDVTDCFELGDDTSTGCFDQALSKISKFRAQFGALSSRLNSVINILDISYENLAATNSRLRDVDYATEIANLTKANILVRAGAGLIIQSQVPAQAALALIQNSTK
ncbi:MAG: hypothetical protein K2X39_09245, partial [Silvanigrellaceae bacterium]|nr:hypothetical protein [Silvanigrellaceae bacterium]